MFTLSFWKDLVERSIRTFIQAAGAAVAVLWIDAGSWSAIKWSNVWEVGLYAGGLAVLTAWFAKKVGDRDTASFGTTPD